MLNIVPFEILDDIVIKLSLKDTVSMLSINTEMSQLISTFVTNIDKHTIPHLYLLPYIRHAITNIGIIPPNVVTLTMKQDLFGVAFPKSVKKLRFTASEVTIAYFPPCLRKLDISGGITVLKGEIPNTFTHLKCIAKSAIIPKTITHYTWNGNLYHKLRVRNANLKKLVINGDIQDSGCLCDVPPSTKIIVKGNCINSRCKTVLKYTGFYGGMIILVIQLIIAVLNITDSWLYLIIYFLITGIAYHVIKTIWIISSSRMMWS